MKNDIKRSHLYKFFRMELEEIERHKWLASEAAGEDVGFEWALLNWAHHHRSGWRRSGKWEAALEGESQEQLRTIKGI